jgi:hypothetical protein
MRALKINSPRFLKRGNCAPENDTVLLMKIRLSKLWWRLGLAVIALCVIIYFIPSESYPGQALLEKTRQSLRGQGFKTDLTDFSFQTSPEMRAREGILMATAPDIHFGSRKYPTLIVPGESNAVLVIWKLNFPKIPHNNKIGWNAFRILINQNKDNVDAACAAVLSGPIAFNLKAADGSYMPLPHLGMLNNLAQTFAWRMVLALHSGDRDDAWTNLMAATRLVTAWNPEPIEASHLSRFNDEKIVFFATWQAMQEDHWPDDQLRQLQQEWESADFLMNLPEIEAFKRANNMAEFEQEKRNYIASSYRPPISKILREAPLSPSLMWKDLRTRWKQDVYLHDTVYEDEANLLTFYCDQEIEFRKAVQFPTWTQMYSLLILTNTTSFQSNESSPLPIMRSTAPQNQIWQIQVASLLGKAAQAESQRRILITAIALKRYYEKHGSYPKKLASLTPDFIKEVPVDFMDGKPLRYRLTQDGHFVLYSAGLGYLDNGGQLRFEEEYSDSNSPLSARESGGVIVWPAPNLANQ